MINTDLITWIQNIDLNDIFSKITDLLDYVLLGIENFFDTFFDLIGYVNNALDSVSSYATGFNNTVQTIFNILPSFYINGIVVIVVIVILFILYRRVV